MYKYFLKPILFIFSPETAHRIVFSSLKFLLSSHVARQLVNSFYVVKDERLKTKVFGLTFDNPVGIAAGFDKDGKLFDELSCFGFSHIEIEMGRAHV